MEKPSRRIRSLMNAEALERVLENTRTRRRIFGIADLREAVKKELSTHAAEIEADAVEFAAGCLENYPQFLAERLRCSVCRGPIPTPKRWREHRYCSARCRQRASRARRRYRRSRMPQERV